MMTQTLDQPIRHGTEGQADDCQIPGYPTLQQFVHGIYGRRLQNPVHAHAGQPARHLHTGFPLWVRDQNRGFAPQTAICPRCPMMYRTGPLNPFHAELPALSEFRNRIPHAALTPVITKKSPTHLGGKIQLACTALDVITVYQRIA